MVKVIDTIDLPVGEARFLVSNTVALGVISTSTSFSKCEVRVGDKNHTIVVGEALSIPFGGQEYSLTLLKLSDKSCTFSFAQKAGK